MTEVFLHIMYSGVSVFNRTHSSQDFFTTNRQKDETHDLWVCFKYD